jgi:type I restriction enzyme M protein
METSVPQTFLRELDKKLWTAADKLRSNLDAAVYKHAVLGLIFLKYVSDSFAQRQAEIAAMVNDPAGDFYLDPAGYDTPAEHEAAVRAEQEERDYYTEKNVFWVPPLARWKTLQSSAKLPPGSELTTGEGKAVYKITSIGRLIDDALEAVEKENPKLKNVLNKNYTQLQIDPANLAGLIDLIATIPFQHADLHAKDILGHVYDWSGATKSLPKESPKGERGGDHQYFLGQFALAEGKKGGQYFTPKSIVSLIVEMIEPYQGRVYNPAMGSGGFFVGDTRQSGVRFAKRCRASAGGVVQSERFIEEHGGTIGDIMVFGQELWAWGAHLRRSKRAQRVRLRRKQPNQSNPTTWRLAAMNMAKTFPWQSKMESGGINFDYVTSTQAKRNRIVDQITGLGAAFSDPVASPLRL